MNYNLKYLNSPTQLRSCFLKIKERLLSIKDSLNNNFFDFSTAAIRYSQDPSVSVNKGIMETSRGDLLQEYEQIARSPF